MIANVSTTKRDGQFWVHIGLDDTELTPRGPFQSPNEAEAAAARIASMCRAMHFGVNRGATAGQARARGR